eukprot:g4593.t1
MPAVRKSSRKKTSSAKAVAAKTPKKQSKSKTPKKKATTPKRSKTPKRSAKKKSPKKSSGKKPAASPAPKKRRGRKPASKSLVPSFKMKNPFKNMCKKVDMTTMFVAGFVVLVLFNNGCFGDLSSHFAGLKVPGL